MHQMKIGRIYLTNTYTILSKPKWSGRLGNNITQLIHSLAFAKFFKYIILVPKNNYIGNSSLLINYYNDTIQINNLQEESDHNNIKYIYNPFFLSHKNFYRTTITYNHKRDIVKDILFLIDNNFNNLFSTNNNYNIDSKSLYIHIRSTDIYKTNHPNTIVYSQPPLSFYNKIIEDNNFNKIYILSDNNNNFVINSLQTKYGDYCNIIDAKNPIDAFNILRLCNHLCVSTSSFSTTAAFLHSSKDIKNIYGYNYLTNIFHHWFLSDLFSTENISNNNITDIKFHIYKINNYKFMDNCFINKNLYTNIDAVDWWKNGNNNFKFNWKFNIETQNLMLNHSIKDIEKLYG